MVLGEEQVQALNKIKDFILNSTDTCFSLYGPAGSGKSIAISYIIKFLVDIGRDYVLCAPTHKAALVMRSYTEEEAMTLHSLLALSPKLDIFELDLRDLMFESGKKTNRIVHNGVVIIDEASMINDDLFDTLITQCEKKDAKVIFISDSKQLAPVKSKTYSKVYTVKNKFGLTKIYRQDKNNPIRDLLETLRRHPVDVVDSCSSEHGKILRINDIKEFLKISKERFKNISKTKNPLEFKILAFTNAQVEKYNTIISSLLYGKNIEYSVGEVLTAYCNGTYKTISYYNSMDYIITEVSKTNQLVGLTLFEGYILSLYDPYEETNFNIFMISRENSKEKFTELAAQVERIRISAIKESNSKRRAMYWRMYYEIFESFTSPINIEFDGRIVIPKDFDYGYAQSIHRSQGSSYNEVAIDWSNINQCRDTEFKRQLQYVAASRTRTNIYLR